MQQGTVKWFNTTKGYGFIEREDGGSDVFVHISEVEKAEMQNLKEGQKIGFEIEENKGKFSAVSLQLL